MSGPRRFRTKEEAEMSRRCSRATARRIAANIAELPELVR
jgi:hypothetical protein